MRQSVLIKHDFTSLLLNAAIGSIVKRIKYFLTAIGCACAYIYTTAAHSLQNISTHAQTNILASELCLDLRLSRRPTCLETLVGKLFWICTAFERFDSYVKLAPFSPSLLQVVLLSLKKKNYEWDYTNNDQTRVQEKNQHFRFISIQSRHKRNRKALSNASTYEISTRIVLQISISKQALIKQKDIGEYVKIWAVFVRKTLIRTKRQRQQIRNSQTCAAEVWRLPQALRSSTDIKTQYAVCELNSIFLYSCIPYCFSHSFFFPQ